MFSGPVRGGTRGGQGDFKWSDVADDKDRENYLGHSILAPVGRWQKNKDITWYNKNGGVIDEDERTKAKREEIQRIKAAEEDALSTALGFKPAPRDPMGSVTIQSSSNAIPLGQSRKPESTTENENADKKAEKAARKAARAAKREKKYLEAQEKKLKKELKKSSKHGERDLEKINRMDSERSRDRDVSSYRDLPEREYEKSSRTDRYHERPHERNGHDHRERPRGSYHDLESPQHSPRPSMRRASSESAHDVREHRTRSRRLDDDYIQLEERRPSRSATHSRHPPRPPSPPIRERYQRPSPPVEYRREGRPRSRSPHRSHPTSPPRRDRHRYSPAPSERRRDRRPRSRTPPSISPPRRNRYHRSPSLVDQQRVTSRRSRSPSHRVYRDH